jgi:outer membrane protein insertion porin family
MEFTDDDRWLNLTFVIDEGPRFKIRDILFEGNELFGDEQLEPLLNFKNGRLF